MKPPAFPRPRPITTHATRDHAGRLLLGDPNGQCTHCGTPYTHKTAENNKAVIYHPACNCRWKTHA